MSPNIRYHQMRLVSLVPRWPWLPCWCSSLRRGRCQKHLMQAQLRRPTARRVFPSASLQLSIKTETTGTFAPALSPRKRQHTNNKHTHTHKKKNVQMNMQNEPKHKRLRTNRHTKLEDRITTFEVQLKNRSEEQGGEGKMGM